MNKIKNIINKWFKKKPKYPGFENCEIRKQLIKDKLVPVFVSKGYNNPKIDFIKDWVDTPIKVRNFFGDSDILVTDQAELLDDYMRFSYDLFCYLRDKRCHISDLTTYEKYVNVFNIQVPGFIKPIENE